MDIAGGYAGGDIMGDIIGGISWCGYYSGLSWWGYHGGISMIHGGAIMLGISRGGVGGGGY